MLELRKITKIYDTGTLKQKALNNVSVSFRECEFASILGPSGSGKTTLLNIIGGLDKYTTGDLIINEVSTKKYKDANWDSYRNHRIGFVFQNYNLITHQTILANVMIALTLSGVSKKDAKKRALKALKDVGLEDHIYKKPNQLSGGQMQRVAIARALVNDPEILLADEPTGALDSETSIQIMDILNNIAKKRLVIMVTHNPELAKKYSTRIIELKDGQIISDSNPYDGKINTKEDLITKDSKNKKTSMKLSTSFLLSFNNLMTKKKRTILVAIAGSIGIIGIALIMALSNGFQRYIDKLQEDTLSSYPFTITSESADITSMLLSMANNDDEDSKTGVVKESKIISSMLSNISTNDLKSFKHYFEDNYDIIKDDIRNIKYSYSIDPLIYTIDATNKLSKVNPNNVFTSIYSSSLSTMYSSMSSIFNQMTNDRKAINDSYDILSGRLPQSYDEVIIVLSRPNTIPDLLVYSLGLRDVDELSNMVSSIMSGKTVTSDDNILSFTYEDLMNVDLRLIEPSDMYKYNNKYKIYENMKDDNKYMNNLYNNATKLKIVGILCPKKGNNSLILSPGVNYTDDLIKHIINYSSNTEIVKKQLNSSEKDVFSNTKFNSKTNTANLNLASLISIDKNKLSSAFKTDVDENTIKDLTTNYMGDINASISVDTNVAFNAFKDGLVSIINSFVDSYNGESIKLSQVDNITNNIISSSNIPSNLTSQFLIPKSVFQTTYTGLLKGYLNAYINAYYLVDQSLTIDDDKTALVNNIISNQVTSAYLQSGVVITTINTMADMMSEAVVKQKVLTKVGALVGDLTTTIASSFNVDANKLSQAFKVNISDSQISRIMDAMVTKGESTQESNLLSLGYQDLDEPTFISFYFDGFDAKENFLSFIDKYNDDVDEEKEIKYTDTTGILMGSVKKIVNSVSYVLIAFVSISLVVSSIMIGVITYISVYERTKEIGILRAVGASKRNISSIFNVETLIIGLLSGLFGIGLTYLLIPIINLIIHRLTGNYDISAVLRIINALSLILLSIILTLIGGLIPSKAASKKDPVEALRSE